MRYKLHINKRTYLLAGIGAFIIALGLASAILKSFFAWTDTHKVRWFKVVQIQLHKPFEIHDREIQTKEIIKVIGEIPNPVDLETDTEKYIYEVFGIEDYKIAIAIAKSESGLREGAFNINSNGTIDVGIFQINSVHFNKEFCTLKDVSTIKGNIDCAYELYKASGWNPWVVFSNGTFINKLE